ncbi:EcsC family protein [Clostridium isatidis]|uniref:EcsC protein family n=1 Tax=Clostridium isatidis TaxID=182773 RepID=A0A343JDG1_9CLOT|nr:EcsC family protein [Clostridium isatidis]ASW43569.1 EcsC protein family [Clostridium isatidis]
MDKNKKIKFRELEKLRKKEKKMIGKKEGFFKSKINPITDKMEELIPNKLKNTLENTFYNGFKIVLKRGNKYIQKLFDKDKIKIEHDINNYSVSKKLNRKSIRTLDSLSRKRKLINVSISTAEGAGLGLLGIGIPDIPIFLAMILKTIYEIALSYGFNYEKEEEQIFIVYLICTALANEEEQVRFNNKLDYIAERIDLNMKLEESLDETIKTASEILSDTLLISKFIQGLPIVGVIGGTNNYSVINKVSNLSRIKYKKRYLKNNL